MRADRRDIARDGRDIWRDSRDIRADQADLRHEYAEQRAGANEHADISRDQADIKSDPRDIQRDRADIRSDEQDIRRDRADLRADQRDLRSDRPAIARGGGQRPDTERLSAAARSGTLTASTQGAAARQAANGAQRTQMTQPTAKPQGITPTVMANNAAAESKKPPSTQPVHQAWYHWFWW